MPEAPLLELRGVSLRSGAVSALEGLSAGFEGAATALIFGPSGSGKSTLVKIAAGILLPTEGELFLEGRAFGSLGKKALLAFRRRSGFVFQDAALWANQSLYDNIAFPLRFHEPGSSPAEVEKAVRRAVELSGCRRDLSPRPADISAGEARLVGLARALVLDPEILFFDDPLGDLDEEGRERVGALLGELRSRGRTLVVAGATPELAGRVADRVLALRGGRLRAAGSYEEACAWAEPQSLGLPGRLPPRRSREGLVGAWEEALAEGRDAGPVEPSPEAG